MDVSEVGFRHAQLLGIQWALARVTLFQNVLEAIAIHPALMLLERTHEFTRVGRRLNHGTPFAPAEAEIGWCHPRPLSIGSLGGHTEGPWNREAARHEFGDAILVLIRERAFQRHITEGVTRGGRTHVLAYSRTRVLAQFVNRMVTSVRRHAITTASSQVGPGASSRAR